MRLHGRDAELFRQLTNTSPGIGTEQHGNAAVCKVLDMFVVFSGYLVFSMMYQGVIEIKDDMGNTQLPERPRINVQDRISNVIRKYCSVFYDFYHSCPIRLRYTVMKRGGLMHIRFTWRLIALATLVVYAVLVFVTLRLLLHNLALVVAFGLTSLVLLYAAWLVVAAAGRTREFIGKGLFVVGLAALTIELIGFFSERQHIRSVIGLLLLAAIYVVLVGWLRDTYWQMKREHEIRMQPITVFKHPMLIINPKSGNGRAVKAHVDLLARNMGITVLMTRKDESVEATTRRAIQAGADVLGIAGGDGSIGAVAKVALAHDLPIIVLPGGTRCHFARDLGLEPKRIVDSLASFKGVERRVDVGVINRRVFLNNVSFGLYADIVDHPEYRDHKMRVSYEVMHSIADGSTALYDLQFQSGNRQVKRAAEVLVGVNRYDFVDLFELGHRERLDEGVLQVTALTELNDRVVKNLLRTTKVKKLREHIDDTGLLQWTNQSFALTNSHHTIVAGVDGEREQYETPVSIRILPKALRIYVPAEGIRHRPKNAFSEPVLRRVWWGALH